ncbi:MAG TPA: phage tail protein [Terriglobales bacterium]|nr:phage tail protein [Terriglobales bacterium]
MAILRDVPYGNQYFRVDLGDGGEGPAAGFSQIVLPDISIDLIEYRTGNDKQSGTHKLPGLTHYGNAILQRGIIGSLNLYDWINQVRNGDANARRTVTITLLSDDLAAVVLTWKLLRAWPVKYSFRDLNAKGTDVAIEELVLAYERLEME